MEYSLKKMFRNSNENEENFYEKFDENISILNGKLCSALGRLLEGSIGKIKV